MHVFLESLTIAKFKIKETSQEDLIQSIIDNLDGGRKRFAFFLGAGASVSSGIPAAKELAQRWLDEMQKNSSEKYKELAEEIDIKQPAEHYSKIFDRRFSHDRTDGHQYIEKIITDKDRVNPSLGYIILANFLIKSDNNIVITTNFDRLTETALLTLFNEHAKVIYHESMLQLIPNDNQTPCVLKIHNDIFCEPESSLDGTKDLGENWKNRLDTILAQYHLIVLGYGGNDNEGIMDYLAKITDPKKIYWCYRSKNSIPSAIRKKDVHTVQINDFDGFIFSLNAKLPTQYSISIAEIEDQIQVNAKEMGKRISDKATTLTKQNNTNSDKAVQNFGKLFANTWWDAQVKIDQEKNADKQDEMYQEAMKQLPESHELIGNYALFLKNIKKDYDKAEKHYKKALELDPNHAVHNGNYALFLKNIKKDYDKAEKHYKKALV